MSLGKMYFSSMTASRALCVARVFGQGSTALFVIAVLCAACSGAAKAEKLTIVDNGGGQVAAVWGEAKPVGSQTQGALPLSPEIKTPEVVLPDANLPEAQIPATKMSDGKSGACEQRYVSRRQGEALVIAEGDYVSKKLKDWAGYHGYELVWNADEFVAQGAVTFGGDFQKAMADFRESMEENDIGFDVAIYRNCVVRVTSRK